MNEFRVCENCGVKLSKTAVVCYQCKHPVSQDVNVSPRKSKTKFKLCENCGRKVSLNGQLCARCGADLSGVSEYTSSTTPDMKRIREEANTSAKSNLPESARAELIKNLGRDLLKMDTLSYSEQVEKLITALDDKSAKVHKSAAIALGINGDSRAVEPLISLLNDPNKFVREDAIACLGVIGNSSSVEALVSFINVESQKSDYEFFLAVKALRRSDDSRADEVMRRALVNPSFSRFVRDMNVAAPRDLMDLVDFRGPRPRPTQVSSAQAVPPKQEFQEIRSERIEQPKKTGDTYVDDCMHFFEEIKETREWSDFKEARAVVEAGNAAIGPYSIVNEQKALEALNLASELREKYPDFYFPYLWLALINRRKKNYAAARNALTEGLRQSRNKNTLCRSLGQTEYETGNLPGAVMWWIRCIITQIQDKTGNGKESDSALDLSHVAEALELPEAREHLVQWANRIRPGVRSTAEASRELYAVTNS